MLAKYNIMGLGLGLGVAAMAQMRSNEPSALQQAQSLMQAQRYDGSAAMGPSSLLDAAERHYISHSDVNKVCVTVLHFIFQHFRLFYSPFFKANNV